MIHKAGEFGLLPPPVDVLCHRPPMVFIDELVSASRERLVSRTRIRPGIPFFEPERGVPAWVGLEYMAQSIAALAGLRARDAGLPIPLGLIIGTRHYDTESPTFAPGTIITCEIVELAAEAGGLGAFDCTLGTPNIVATARLSVFGGDRNNP